MVCGSRALQSTPPRALGVPLAKANGPLRPAPAPRQVAVPESRCGATRGLSPHRVRWRFWRIIFYHARHRLRGGEGDKGVRPTLGSKRRMALCPLFYIRSRIDSTERRSPRWGWLGFLCPTYYSFRVHAFEGGPHEGALSYVLRPSSRISYHADSAQTLLRAAANATRTPLCARLTGSTVELGSVAMAAQMRTQEIKCYAATFRG